VTTIVATRKEMAADRRVSDSGAGTRYKTTKIRRIGGVIVGAGGANPDVFKFFKWLESGMQDEPPKMSKDEGFAAMVVSPAGLFITDKDCVFEEVADSFYAIGTGAQAALGAMHMKATPRQAVEIAAKVDNNTGDGVDVLTL
jgi:ATP-dependent protease HslVU (ClpYQ) peptidase subunit